MSRNSVRFSGVTEKNKRISWILSAILVLIGIAAIIAAFTVTVSGGYTSASSNESVVINGVMYHNVSGLGSTREPLPDNFKTLLVVFGLLLVANGISSYMSLKTIDKSYVELTDRGVTGAQFSRILFLNQENKFDLPYEQIRSVQVPNPSALTPTINILSNNQSYSVKIAEAEKAARLINNALSR